MKNCIVLEMYNLIKS